MWINLAAALVVGGWYLVQPPGRQAEVRLLVGNTFAANKDVTPLDVAVDIWRMYYSEDYVAAPPPPGDRTHAYGGLPRAAGPEVPGARVLVNAGYVAGYSDERGNPLWAAYRMTDVTPLPAPTERPDRFETDPRTAARVSPDAYTGTGYDRGHLAPNYAIATRYGAEAQRETFLMSNIIPQRHGLNAGLWKQLEQKAATSYPARCGEVWVVAGPVFGDRPARLPSRTGAAPLVPEACFMILADESEGRVRTMAFVFPQDPKPGAELEDYVATIDEIEARTGLDFFAELDDAAESALEARRASAVW